MRIGAARTRKRVPRDQDAPGSRAVADSPEGGMAAAPGVTVGPEARVEGAVPLMTVCRRFSGESCNFSTSIQGCVVVRPREIVSSRRDTQYLDGHGHSRPRP